MLRYFRITAIIILSVMMVCSCTIVGDHFTNPETYAHTIEVLDENRSTVLTLSAASAAASAAISALPSDICSSLSSELSDFSSYFLIILSVIYLEKYMLTILGAVACYVLIPVGCSALLVFCFYPYSMLQNIGIKLLALSFALLAVIPSSIWVSDQINAIYSKSIELTIDSANTVSEQMLEVTTDENNKEGSVIDKAKDILGDLSGSVAGIIEQFKSVINRFIEAIAVMIVTTCLIPILVALFFTGMIKTLFGVEIVQPEKLLPPKKKPKNEQLTPVTAITENK